MASWTSRLYQPGDEYVIKELYESVFNVPKSIDFWRWRYLENPTGRIAILLAVSDEEQSLVGQYTLCPLLMKLGNKDVVGSLSLDTMVHPDFRRQGMLKKLAKNLYRLMAAEGIPLVYGFPNEQSHHGLTKYLDWKDLVDPLPIYVRPLKFSGLLKRVLPSDYLTRVSYPVAKFGYQILRRTRGRQDRQFTVTTLARFDERVDKLWHQAREIAQILVHRDRSYLNWRYAFHPRSDYTIFAIEDKEELLGYCVLRIQDLAGLQTGFIADLLVNPEANYAPDALLEAAVRQAEAAGCDMVNCLMLEHILYIAALKRCGFIRAPARVMPQELYLGVRNNGSSHPDAFIHNSRNWYITWGDHDRV